MKRVPVAAALIIVVIITLKVLQIGSERLYANLGDERTLDRVLRNGTLHVCYVVWPPAVIKDEKTGDLSGHYIDAIEHIASKVGVKIAYQEKTFGTLLQAVKGKDCDVGLSLFVNIPRALEVAYTTPRLYAGNSALVREKDDRFRTIWDANLNFIRIVVEKGESGHIFAVENLNKAKVTPIEVSPLDPYAFMREVQEGRADIAVGDATSIYEFARRNPDTKDLFPGHPFDMHPDAWIVRIEDVTLLNFLNNSLLSMDASGKTKELFQRYGDKRPREYRP